MSHRGSATGGGGSLLRQNSPDGSRLTRFCSTEIRPVPFLVPGVPEVVVQFGAGHHGRHPVPLVAVGDVHMHVRSRKPLQDVLTATRVGKPLTECGHALQRSAEQEIATKLLAFPDALHDFEEYLWFLDDAEGLLQEAGLESVVQLASFHPQYLFAGEPPQAASHYSNRAPYPVIHLLREDMLTRVLEDFPAPEQIPERNIATLNTIGVEELARRWRAMMAS